MWLLRLLKKLFFLALFIIVVGVLMVVFFGSMWFNNNYDAATWNGLIASQTPPTGAIDQWFGAGAWFTGVIADKTGIALSALSYVIPIGFSLVFGIIIYTVLSIILHFSFKAIRNKHKAKKQQQKYERDYDRRRR